MNWKLFIGKKSEVELFRLLNVIESQNTNKTTNKNNSRSCQVFYKKKLSIKNQQRKKEANSYCFFFLFQFFFFGFSLMWIRFLLINFVSLSVILTIWWIEILIKNWAHRNSIRMHHLKSFIDARYTTKHRSSLMNEWWHRKRLIHYILTHLILQSHDKDTYILI